jgi:L-threonylcarbamoyladenylate synthase
MKKVDFIEEHIPEIVSTIRAGKICLLPSDTLYGLSCSAQNEKAVEKIYRLKQRENDKPFIILVPNIETIENFGIEIKSALKNFLTTIWPAPLTAVFAINNEKLAFLHRGTNSLGFRIPNNALLLKILEQVGPITSTTANISGEKPCETTKEVEEILGEQVALYIENGKMTSEPSTVVSFVEDKPQIIRNGIVKITDELNGV